MINKAVTSHHMEARFSEVVSPAPSHRGEAARGMFQDPNPLVEKFEETAARAIANGADVAIPAEGRIAVILAEIGMARSQDAPVMDVFGMTWS